ncbi:MAG: ABC transporter permease [Thermoplasmata archaeon]
MTASPAKEANVVLAVAARDVVRLFRDWKNTVTFAVFFPVAFLGILAGTIGQNLGGGLGFDYLQFALLGTAAALLMQFTTMSVTTLVQERESGFTQEIFVSPTSRVSIFLGKILGGGLTGLICLPALFVVAFVIGVPLSFTLIGIILLLAPVFCLMGGAFGVLLSGIFGTNPKAVDQASILTMFPQMFLSGAIIPIRSSSGVLYVLVRVMPLTYLVDLVRGAFYQGTPTYGQVVLYNPFVDLAISVAVSVVFLVAGMILFVRGERNR